MALLEPEFAVRDGYVSIALPLTNPTGKVRVKRPFSGRQAIPLATRRDAMMESDYLEWQIGYYTAFKNSSSILPGVSIQRNGKTRYANELMWLIHHAKSSGWLSGRNAIWQTALDLVRNPSKSTLEESEKVEIETASTAPIAELTQLGFRRTMLRVPFYAKHESRYGVEIVLSAKQRAVGLQAMVYARVPIGICRDKNDASLAGRTAAAKERACYRLDAANVDLLADLVAAFALASPKHHGDMRMLLNKAGCL